MALIPRVVSRERCEERPACVAFFLQQMYSMMNVAMRNLPEVVAEMEKSKAKRAELRHRFLLSLHRMAVMTTVPPTHATTQETKNNGSSPVVTPASTSNSPVAVRAPVTLSVAVPKPTTTRSTVPSSGTPASRLHSSSSSQQYQQPLFKKSAAMQAPQLPTKESQLPAISLGVPQVTPTQPSTSTAPTVPMMYVPIMLPSSGFGQMMNPSGNGTFSGMQLPMMAGALPGGFSMWPGMQFPAMFQSTQSGMQQGPFLFPGSAMPFQLQSVPMQALQTMPQQVYTGQFSQDAQQTM